MRVVERTILAVFMFAFVVGLGVSAYAISNARDNVSNNEQARAARLRIIQLEAVQNRLFESESAARAFALTGERIFLEEAESFRGELEQAIEQLRNSALAASQGDEFSRLSSQIAQRLALSDRLINTGSGSRRRDRGHT